MSYVQTRFLKIVFFYYTIIFHVLSFMLLMKFGMHDRSKYISGSYFVAKQGFGCLIYAVNKNCSYF